MIGRLVSIARLMVRLVMTVQTLKFVSVGLIGLLYAESMLYMLVDVINVPHIFSIIITAETSMLVNFYINDKWTFGSERTLGGSFLYRFVKYHASRISSLILNVALYLFFTEYLMIHYLISNVIAVFIAFIFNYMTSFLWVWKFQGTLTAKEVRGRT
ncbi:MAG: GtrA family protein [Aigarchaeota archaeon]|nr:GtrA family protein [Aigarchaeota archaeon]MDW8092394.1 GtrA family protein [Nitrososphaerota archaeon]